MADIKPNRLWSILICVLIIVIIASAVIALSRYQPAQAIEICIPDNQELTGCIEIGGAVTNSGIYSFSGNDSIDSLLQAAGGTTLNADTAALQLIVPNSSVQSEPQKININRAGAWLLEALPAIGETKAKAIVIYREQNGSFKFTSEIMNVEGIGQALFDQIKDLITITD